jgi:hypothetical protein
VSGMSSILLFFSRYEILIYLLLVIGFGFTVRALVRARREMDESLYGLERESARSHVSQAVAVLSLLIFLAAAEVVLTVFLAPVMPASALLLTPTMNPLITPTNTISSEFLASLGFQTPQSTPTAQSSGCIPGQIMVTFPKPGDVVKGSVTLTGTANIPNFGFYKYEFSPLGTDIWSTIQASRDVIPDGNLGVWNTSLVSPGDYNLRLVVIDNQGNALPPCIVPVRVSAP